MASNKLKGDDLIKLGFDEGPIIGMVLTVFATLYKGKSKKHQLELLERLYLRPALYIKHKHLGHIAGQLIQKPKPISTPDLRQNGIEYPIYGKEGIEAGAINQMEIAMKLPITKAGALMPDAHQGYGLPIGGVLATQNAVIPYGVGVDIGCRMCMTLYDIPPVFDYDSISAFKELLLSHSKFGNEVFNKPGEDKVLDRPEFNEIKVLKSLKDRAYQQLGSSGGGNHFVEFGITHLTDDQNEFNLPPGKYLALLTHSGSRGLGANIARHYTRLAIEQCALPSKAKHLAWLDLSTELGQEYWLAMNLAGDYASACHHQIHNRIAKAFGESHLVMIENHHNFAWKEKDIEGDEIIVHRKGATPASRGELGIIPGSMVDPGYIVRGKGDAKALNSASHGAGRQMSRTQAKQRLSRNEVAKVLKKAQVKVIGGGIDEAPMAYKNIDQVMKSQQDLVEVIGSFLPKVVRMSGDRKFKSAN